jgi:hypothetical protein
MKPKDYEKGKYEFEENDEDEEFEKKHYYERFDENDDYEEFEENDEDEMLKDYKITERTRMKKNKKKVIRHYSIRKFFKIG